MIYVFRIWQRSVDERTKKIVNALTAQKKGKGQGEERGKGGAGLSKQPQSKTLIM